jgi:hypothetical protein
MKKEILNIDELLHHKKANIILKHLFKNIEVNHIINVITEIGEFRFAYAYPNVSEFSTVTNIIEIRIDNIVKLDQALSYYLIINQNKPCNL